MKKLILLIALVVLVMILAGSSASAVSDTTPIDSDIPHNEITASQTEASNSSASAAIMITMYSMAESSPASRPRDGK